MSDITTLVLVTVAALSASLTAGVAGPLADALARRHPIVIPPPARWVALAVRSPQRAGVAGLVGALVAWRWEAEPLAAVVVLAALGVAGVAAMVDRRCHRLPDLLVAPLGLGLVVVAGGWSLVSGEPRWLVAAGVAGAAAGGVLILGWAAGMGFGDVKFGAALGLGLGWSVGSPTVAVFAGLGLVGLAAAGASVWWGWRRTVGGCAPRWFPFGPFLAAAALVGLLLLGPPGDPGGLWVEPVRPGVPGHR